MVLSQQINDDDRINILMRNIKGGVNYEFRILKEKGNYGELYIGQENVENLERMEDYDGEEEDEKSVILEYNEIIPVSFEKL